ncbi:MAG: tetratricopeptide (TPR) repeat protein [Rhodothermales bacterium]
MVNKSREGVAKRKDKDELQRMRALARARALDQRVDSREMASMLPTRVASGAVATREVSEVLVTRKPGPSLTRRVLRGVAITVGLFPPFWPITLGTWLFLRRRPPTRSLRLVQKAIADLDRGNNGIAVKRLQEAHFLDPTNSDALYWLGLVMSAQDRPEDAIEALSLVAERIPGLPEVETALTDAYLDTDKPEAALYHAQRLFDSAPYDTNSVLKLAEAFTASGQPALAIRTLSQAPLHRTRLTKDLIRVHYELGRLLQDAGEGSEARAHFERAFAADAKFEDVADRLEALKQGDA